jgi:hypothetical protein
LRGSDRHLGSGAAGFLFFFALNTTGGCSVRTLTVVDPDPCAPTEAGVPGCVPPGLLDQLVAWWRFDDGAGSSVARDSWLNGNNGTLHGLDAETAWVAGRSGGALNIAAAGWVQVPDSPSIDSITDQVTLTAWAYLDGAIDPNETTGLYGTTISRQVGTGIDQYYHLSININDHPNLFIKTTGGNVILRPPSATDFPAIPQRTWTHLAGTYDGAMARIYLNGAEITKLAMSATGKFAKDTTPLVLGGNGNNASVSELFPGRIDDIMLYRRALSATEIGQIAAGVLFPGGVVDAGAPAADATGQ